jgi:hypothetical protein
LIDHLPFSGIRKQGITWRYYRRGLFGYNFNNRWNRELLANTGRWLIKGFLESIIAPFQYSGFPNNLESLLGQNIYKAQVHIGAIPNIRYCIRRSDIGHPNSIIPTIHPSFLGLTLGTPSFDTVANQQRTLVLLEDCIASVMTGFIFVKVEVS